MVDFPASLDDASVAYYLLIFSVQHTAVWSWSRGLFRITSDKSRRLYGQYQRHSSRFDLAQKRCAKNTKPCAMPSRG